MGKIKGTVTNSMYKNTIQSKDDDNFFIAYDYILYFRVLITMYYF